METAQEMSWGSNGSEFKIPALWDWYVHTIDTMYESSLSFPGSSDSKESTCNAGETRVWSLGGEDLLEEGMQPTPVFLPGESHEQRSLVGYSVWGHKE